MNGFDYPHAVMMCIINRNYITSYIWGKMTVMYAIHVFLQSKKNGNLLGTHL